MTTEVGDQKLSPQAMAAILEVTSRLASAHDVSAMLDQVVEAARHLLEAEEALVWKTDSEADHLVPAAGAGRPEIRAASHRGAIGACARERRLIIVTDCASDPCFDPATDNPCGLNCRCMLALPLVDHADELLGVLQVFNSRSGVFDRDDQLLAQALAAQCALVLERIRASSESRRGQRMHRELEMAREVQMSTLPDVMPELAGYEVFGLFRPAGLTGGDTFDLIQIDQGFFILMGDATGHGIAPALSAIQMQGMLRVAFRAGADLESAFVHVNNQLLEDLPADRFVTAFVGLLDPERHRLRFHSGGQGPIFLYRAAEGDCKRYGPTSFPLAAAHLDAIPPASELEMAPGDILALLSDGIFEYHNRNDELFGEQRVRELIRAGSELPVDELSARIFEAVEDFAEGAEQGDDMTVVLVKRRTESK